MCGDCVYKIQWLLTWRFVSEFSVVVHFHCPVIERKDAKRFMSTADLGSAFWGMVLVVASTNSITLRIAAALLLSAPVVVLIIERT